MELLKAILGLPKNIVMFFRNTIAELKLVEWLKASKVIQYTIFVLAFLFFGAILIIVIDKTFLSIRSLIII